MLDRILTILRLPNLPHVSPPLLPCFRSSDPTSHQTEAHWFLKPVSKKDVKDYHTSAYRSQSFQTQTGAATELFGAERWVG